MIISLDVESLRDPSAFPHEVDSDVQILETHISWVVLAGPFAYKLKKPLVTEFLDYGTLEKRHRACCEELRLNTRTSQGLYLDVVPIGIMNGQVRIDCDSNPIEYAVRMRRFPAGSLLSERLAASRVTDQDVVRLAVKYPSCIVLLKSSAIHLT